MISSLQAAFLGFAISDGSYSKFHQVNISSRESGLSEPNEMREFERKFHLSASLHFHQVNKTQGDLCVGGILQPIAPKSLLQQACDRNNFIQILFILLSCSSLRFSSEGASGEIIFSPHLGPIHWHQTQQSAAVSPLGSYVMDQDVGGTNTLLGPVIGDAGFLLQSRTCRPLSQVSFYFVDN